MLSTNQFSNNLSVNLYPNPASKELNVSLRNLNSFENVKVEMFNVLGKKMLSKEISSTNTSINISELNNGIYMLRIINNNGELLLNKKVLKQF